LQSIPSRDFDHPVGALGWPAYSQDSIAFLYEPFGDGMEDFRVGLITDLFRSGQMQ
jgi:hypothetical protein